MEHTQLLRVKSLNKKKHGANIIHVAARHNLREIQSERGADSHIDPSRTQSNVILRGACNADDVAAKAVKLMEAAGITKPRSNGSLGIEIIFSLPPSFGIEELEFFNAAVKWAEEFFEIPILSAVIHYDEAAPHIHIIMLPLFNGRMIGREKLGDREKIKAMHADFHTKVAARYGLKPAKPAKRLSAPTRAKMADSIIITLKKALKGINEPTFWDAMRDTITEKPEPLMAFYGIEYVPPKEPEKTFNSIMIKNCPERKHKTAIAVQNKNAIAVTPEFNPIASLENVQPLSCVAVADSPSQLSSVDTSQSSNQGEYVREREEDLPACHPMTNDTEYTRERDEDYSAGSYDYDTGEHIQPPTKVKPKSVKFEQARITLATIAARKRSNEARTTN